MHELRSDLTTHDVNLYIESFYRILTPKSLVENIKTLPVKLIKNIRAGKGIAEVCKPGTQPTATGAKIMFNYEKKKEIVGFEHKYACRYLAYLLLSRSVPRCTIPIDIFEANLFFKKYFEGDLKDVFKRCCQLNGDDSEDVLSYFRNRLNWSNLYNSEYTNYQKKKKETRSSSWACIFEQLTRSSKKSKF